MDLPPTEKRKAALRAGLGGHWELGFRQDESEVLVKSSSGDAGRQLCVPAWSQGEGPG